jgi:hypothetical protein
VVEVFDSSIFYPKIINNESELDGTPFVAPESRGGFSFIVTFSQNVGSEEIVDQENAGPGKAIAALANFEVDLSQLKLKIMKFRIYESNFDFT